MTSPARSAQAQAGSPDLTDALRAALRHHQAGELDAAAALYEQVIAALPDNPDALHLLGVIAHQKGDETKSLSLIGRAIAAHDTNASYHSNYGVVLQKLGRVDEAIESYRRALELDPSQADASGNLGNLHFDRGEVDEAIRCYEAAIRFQPRVRSAHKHLASLYLDRDRLEEAAELFKQYLAVAPDDAEANSNYGLALERLDKLEEAERHYRRAHELAPQSAEICSNIGNILKRLDRRDEAEQFLQKAAALAPSDKRVLANLALALLEAKKYEQAIPKFRRLVEMEPNCAAYHCDLGSCLGWMGHPVEALPHLLRACELEPEVASHAANVGAAFLQLSRNEDGMAAYRRAAQLDPASPFIHANLCTALALAGRVDETNLFAHYAMTLSTWTEQMNPSLLSSFRSSCDFDALASLGDVISTCDRLVEPENLIGVFLHLRPLTDTLESDRRVTALHRKWGAKITKDAASSLLPPLTTRGEGKIKIGLLSSDLRSHAVAKFLWPFFDHCDRERFEIHCYSPFDLPGDPVQAALRRRVDGFRIVSQLSHRELAEVVRGDRIDILFDLNGATRDGRIEAMAWRAAPVQVNYLGYGGTSGLADVDYALMDRFVQPTEPDLWTETPIVMHTSWVCFSDYPDEPIAPEPPMVRNGIATFGTMNSSYKFTPEMIALWARIMHEVPGSRFLFVRPEIKSVVLQTNLAKEFAKHDIAANRLFFIANPGGQSGHLAYYNEFDIALDTYPAVGGTTTCDTLWMGVPVVGKYGPNLHQRLTYAVSNHIGFPEFAVDNDDAYVALAVALARDPDRLRELRASLRPAIQASPLCDGAGFMQDFQDRMMELVRKHGLRP